MMEPGIEAGMNEAGTFILIGNIIALFFINRDGDWPRGTVVSMIVPLIATLITAYLMLFGGYTGNYGGNIIGYWGFWFFCGGFIGIAANVRSSSNSTTDETSQPTNTHSSNTRQSSLENNKGINGILTKIGYGIGLLIGLIAQAVLGFVSTVKFAVKLINPFSQTKTADTEETDTPSPPLSGLMRRDRVRIQVKEKE